MQKQKLTTALAAKYFPCSAIYTLNIKRFIGDITGITANNNNISFLGIPIPIENVCLLLTPLPKITDEDAMELARLLMPSVFTSQKWNVERQTPGTSVKIFHSLEAYALEIECISMAFHLYYLDELMLPECSTNIVKVIDFLTASEWTYQDGTKKKKPSYDIHGGIKSGWAEDATQNT